jgi:hypothetical protein
VSGVLSLLCHVALEPAVALQTRDWALLAVLGLGPLGAHPSFCGTRRSSSVTRGTSAS